MICASVCLLVTTMSYARTAEWIEMLFGYGISGTKEQIIMWHTSSPQRNGQFWRHLLSHIVKYREYPG